MDLQQLESRQFLDSRLRGNDDWVAHGLLQLSPHSLVVVLNFGYVIFYEGRWRCVSGRVRHY